MERPPTIIEIQDALAEMRLPHEQALAALYLRRDLFLDKYRDTPVEGTPRFKEKANIFRRQIRERQKLVEAYPKLVYGTLILAEPGTDNLQVLVLVPTQYMELPPFNLRGWTVQLVTGSLRLQRSRTGDVLPQGLVVSVNGSPILSPARRQKALASRMNFPVNLREQRKLERERRRQDYERFLKERREREQERLDQIEGERLTKEKLAREAREKRLAERREKQIALQEEAAQRNHKELARWEEGRKQQVAREEERTSLLLPPPPPELLEPRTPFITQLGVLIGALLVGSIIGYLTIPSWFSLVGLLCMGTAALVLRSRR